MARSSEMPHATNRNRRTPLLEVGEDVDLLQDPIGGDNLIGVHASSIRLAVSTQYLLRMLSSECLVKKAPANAEKTLLGLP